MCASAEAAQVNSSARACAGGAQRLPARRVVEQGPQPGLDALRVRLGVGDRVAADLGQRRAVRGQHRGAAGHRLQHRQPEPLAPAGEGDDERAAEVSGQVGEAQVAGADQAQVRGNRGDRLVHFLAPAAAAGEHQRGRVGQVGHGRGPAGDQRGHVLARLQAAEVGHVRLAVQAEPVGDLRAPAPGWAGGTASGPRRDRRRRSGSGRRRARGPARPWWPWTGRAAGWPAGPRCGSPTCRRWRVTGLCASGSVKNVRSWMVTTTGTPGRSGIV